MGLVEGDPHRVSGLFILFKANFFPNHHNTHINNSIQPKYLHTAAIVCERRRLSLLRLSDIQSVQVM